MPPPFPPFACSLPFLLELPPQLRVARFRGAAFPVYIVALREIGAEMAAAALLAAQRRARDQPPHRHDARRAPRRQIERLAAGDPCIHLAPQRIQHGERAAQSFAIAEQADLAPHQILHFRRS